MYELTGLEQSIYCYIKERIESDGYAPSVRDISTALNIRSTSTVHSYLRRLEEKGYITKEQGKSRALKLEHRETGERMLRVPLLGKVTAGVPITAVQTSEGYVDFPACMTRGRSGLFALRVVGESMINAGILNGDIVIVEKTPSAQNGEMVVALIEDEATVKTFYKENGHFRLQPQNDAYEPIIVDEVVILGKVVGLIRNY